LLRSSNAGALIKLYDPENDLVPPIAETNRVTDIFKTKDATLVEPFLPNNWQTMTKVRRIG